MLDKNGIEMKSGMIVKISGAYFKNDNGLFFIDRSPGDASWLGKGYSLCKISKTGKISKAKYNLCSWPLVSYVSDRYKTAAANDHNRKYAEIEVVTIPNMSEVKAHFQSEANEARDYLAEYKMRWPDDEKSISIYRDTMIQRQSIADSIA